MLTPLDVQPGPPILAALKAAQPMTSLLDMIKGTDWWLGFTEVLKSPTAYETLECSVLQPRLLLCLPGIGTNRRAAAWLASLNILAESNPVTKADLAKVGPLPEVSKSAGIVDAMVEIDPFLARCLLL